MRVSAPPMCSSLSSLPPTLHQSYITQPQLPVWRYQLQQQKCRQQPWEAPHSTSSNAQITAVVSLESCFWDWTLIETLSLVTNILKMKVLPATWCYLDTPECITFQQVFSTLHIWEDHFNKGKAHSPDYSDASSTSPAIFKALFPCFLTFIR